MHPQSPNIRNEAYPSGHQARTALPDDPQLAQILAEASYQKKEFAYAIQLLEQSAAHRPLDAKQLYILGMSRLSARDKLRSRQALSEAPHGRPDGGVVAPAGAVVNRSGGKLPDFGRPFVSLVQMNVESLDRGPADLAKVPAITPGSK